MHLAQLNIARLRYDIDDPSGHRPTVDEAQARLDHLCEHGSTPHAFSFADTFPPPAGDDAG